MSNMMHDESMTTATTAKLMPQHGGKYSDHEFVKVASKVIKGVERAPYNKFETILVNYDKMKEIKGKRNLTKTEQRIYDKADKLIQKEFDAMFKKADTMLDQLDRKTTAQKGGSLFGNKVAPAAATSDAPVKDPATNATSDAPAAAATTDAKTPSLFSRFIKKNSVSPAPDSSAATPDDAIPAPQPAPGAVDTSPPPAAKEVPAPLAAGPAAAPGNKSSPQQQPPPVEKPFLHPRDDEDPPAPSPALAVAPTAPAAPAATPKGADNETSFMDSNRFYRWIVSLLKGIWEWIKGLFTGAFSDKFEQLRKEFSADELFKKFGNEPTKIEELTGEFKEQAEKLQRLVATGIGGAASASIDMILNAFSMSPVFGTTILVWRMFQNMLMIMGASLSVQSADSTFSTRVATIAAAESKSGGGKAKNNVTKRIKTDIRQLNRSLKRYMHFPHRQQGPKGMPAGSGYSYT